MIIDGSSIPSPLTVHISQKFKPVQKLALQWAQLESGNWIATDRGASADVYESEILVYGKEVTIETLLETIEYNRSSGVFYFYDLNYGERIFGANIDYTQTVDTYSNAYKVNITAGQRTQGSFKGFGVSLKCRNLSPSFNGAATLPTMSPLVGYSGDSIYTNDNIDTYDGTAFYRDLSSDSGVFECILRLTQEECANLLGYIRLQRGSTISLTGLSGVSYPFGRRSTSYPYNVKILKYEIIGQSNTAGSRWDVKIKFVENI